MNIASTQATPISTEQSQSIQAKRAGLQLALLKKALEAQKATMEQIMNESEGKGQHLDIRV